MKSERCGETSVDLVFYVDKVPTIREGYPGVFV